MRSICRAIRCDLFMNHYKPLSCNEKGHTLICGLPASLSSRPQFWVYYVNHTPAWVKAGESCRRSIESSPFAQPAPTPHVRRTSLSSAALQFRWDNIPFPGKRLRLQRATCRKPFGTFYSLLDDASSGPPSEAAGDCVRNRPTLQWKYVSPPVVAQTRS